MRLIDADELKKEVKTMFCPDGYKIMCLGRIDNAPTVDSPNYGGQVVPDMLQGWRYEERPQGEWISHIEYCKQHNLIPTGYKLFKWCNRCNCPNEKRTKFCPNCGAKMKEGDTND